MADSTTPRQAALWFASKGYSTLPLHSLTEAGGCTCGDAACESVGKHPFARPRPSRAKGRDGRSRRDSWLVRRALLAELRHLTALARHRRGSAHGGDETWAEIGGQPTRGLPHTWRVHTGGGGVHICFQNTPRIRAASSTEAWRLRVGARRGVGGYIVSGRLYTWQPQCSPRDAPLAEPPAWLAKLIGNRTHLGTTMPPQAWANFLREQFAEGARRKALLRIVGKLATVLGPAADYHRADAA